MPRKFLGVVAIGRLTGGYEYRSEAQPPASGTRARWSGCAPGSSGPRSVATYATAEDDACWARPGRPYEQDDLVRQITLRPTGQDDIPIQRFHCLLGLRRPPLRKQQHADVVPQFHCLFARVAVNSAYDVQHFSQLRQRVGDPRERRAWSSAFRPQARIRAGSHAGQCQHGRLSAWPDPRGVQDLPREDRSSHSDLIQAHPLDLMTRLSCRGDMLYATPSPDTDDRRTLDEIESMRRSLRHMVRATPRWTRQLRRNLTARAIAGSNTIEGYAATVDDVEALMSGEEPLRDRGEDTCRVGGLPARCDLHPGSRRRRGGHGPPQSRQDPPVEGRERTNVPRPVHPRVSPARP